MQFIKFLGSEPDQPHINHVVQPFQRFTAQEASAGIVLLVCAITALIWANSPWSHNYYALWEPISQSDSQTTHWTNLRTFGSTTRSWQCSSSS